MITATRSHVGASNDKIIKLAGNLSKNGPSVETLRQLANECELLAMHLENVSRERPLLWKPIDQRFLHCGNYVRSVRRSQGMTVRQLSDASLLSITCISMTENAVTCPSMTTQLCFSYHLKTPAKDLWPALKTVPTTDPGVSEC